MTKRNLVMPGRHERPAAGLGEPDPSLPRELVGVSALAVVAHPDDESFGLGAVLAAMAEAGSSIRVLCLTSGEASTLGSGLALATVRRREISHAAERLGLSEVHLVGFADGGLAAVPHQQLDAVIDRHLGEASAVVTFEARGVTGHPDHCAASAAAFRAAVRHRLMLVEWGVPPDVATGLRRELGVPFSSLDGPDVVELAVDRKRQLAAVACHLSQSTGNAVLARRLELQRERERLRIRHVVP